MRHLFWGRRGGKKPEIGDNVVTAVISFKIADNGVQNPDAHPAQPAQLESGEFTLKASIGDYLEHYDVITRLYSLGIVRDGYLLVGWYTEDFGNELVSLNEALDFAMPLHDLLFVMVWEPDLLSRLFSPFADRPAFGTPISWIRPTAQRPLGSAHYFGTLIFGDLNMIPSGGNPVFAGHDPPHPVFHNEGGLLVGGDLNVGPGWLDIGTPWTVDNPWNTHPRGVGRPIVAGYGVVVGGDINSIAGGYYMGVRRNILSSLRPICVGGAQA